MAIWILKRIEFIQVEAKNEDEALDLFGEGKGEHTHEIEEIYEA